jgi:hypothetical protein
VEAPKITMGGFRELPGLGAPITITGAAFEEDLTPYSGSRVLGHFKDGRPAVIENSFGKGRTILIGSFAALGYEEHPGPDGQQFFMALARLAGAWSDVTVSGAPGQVLQVRRLIGKKEQVVFAFNESGSTVHATVSLGVEHPVLRATGWSDDSEVPFQTDQNKVVLHKTFAPQEVWIVSLQMQ